MYYSLDGWWGPTCEYLFRRFDIPTGKAWHGKRINGYLYTAIEPRDPQDEKETAPYFNWIMPTYANNFYTWWKERYLPEILRNFEYIDNYDAESATLQELMIYLEEAIDIQERHFRLHWILNWAQFTASMEFVGTVKELIGDVNEDTLGKVNVSREDRNWDSIKELWKLKEEVKKNNDLKQAFDSGDTADQIRPALEKAKGGEDSLKKIQGYAKEFGYKAIYTHEYVFPLYVEDNTPIIEQIKSYLASDFDYNKVYDQCIKEQQDAIAYLREQIKDKSKEDKDRFEEALNLNLKMLPLTPDHHFYMDQGTFARMRLVLLTGGRKIIKQAKEEIEKAKKITPCDWVGTVTNKNMYEEPYHTLWGYPEKFEREQENKASVKGEINGLAASAGVVEGTARIVQSPKQFNEVKQGDIMVCIMTNPAWAVVFSKISGIVTDAGGVLSHSAAVAREFMIPAVVGTGDSTRKIKDGDKVRVDGNKGLVQILQAGAGVAAPGRHGTVRAGGEQSPPARAAVEQREAPKIYCSCTVEFLTPPESGRK